MKKTLLLFVLLLLLCVSVSAKTDVLRVGESTLKDGKTFLVDNIGTNSVIIKMGGVQKIIDEGKRTRWEGYNIYVEEISTSGITDENKYAIISICTDEKETCNNLDDDCDGNIDDGVERDCGIELGACRKGTQKCYEGEWGLCEGSVIASKEICNGKDDDCDGKEDENITSRKCGLTLGACSEGTQNCKDGRWTDCKGAVNRKPEICNKLDDDCDGEIDENDVCKPETEEKDGVEQSKDTQKESGWSKFINWLKNIF
ncbi:MAG: MopE-related protein [archaeon]